MTHGGAEAATGRLLRGEVARVVVIVAHPDDETVGAGAHLARWAEATVVHVTDGAPRDRRWWGAPECATREEYAERRSGELRLALAIAAVGPERTHALGIADQESAGAMTVLACRIAQLLWELRPEAVLTHPYEGGHPDHDTTAFAVHAARRLLAREGVPPPPLVEFASYHDRGGAMSAGEFLPHPGCRAESVALDPAARERRKRMFACHASQRDVLRHFSTEMESFRPAPAYCFTAAPHPGVLYYERWEWGMTGERWRELARDALRALELEEAR